MRIIGYVSAVVLCVLVGAMGMLILTQGVQADSVDGMRAITWVKMAFAEDHMKHHGRQIQSYTKNVPTGGSALLTVVPPGKRFIITDINGDSSSFHLSTAGGSGSSKFYAYLGPTLGAGYVPHIALNSGVAFEAEESIYAGGTSGGGTISISGYYVDMPQP